MGANANEGGFALKKTMAVGVGALALMLGAPLAAVGAGGESTLSSLDQHWLKAAAQGDAYEVTVGKLAQQKGGSDGVKSFGAMLEKDHSKSLRETNAVGQKLKLKLQPKPNPLQEQIIALLSQAKDSATFDSLFAQISMGDHRLDIEEATEEAQKGQASSVKQLAKKELPTLKKHLAAATDLAKQAGSGGGSGSSGSS
jgi:putative membrane protein